MKKKYIWLLLLVFTAWGCFDDKGNYDYKELNKITFENIPYNNSIYFGDPLYCSQIKICNLQRKR